MQTIRTKDGMTALEAFVLTLYGEARGEPVDGIYAVANVIINRANDKKQRYGTGIKGVCLKKWQFSCWNENDPNCEKLLSIDWNDIKLSNIKRIASDILARTPEQQKEKDKTLGSLHYFVKAMKTKPAWAKGKKPVYEVGGHVFYNDID